jgi:hypothetical protein
MLRDLRVLTWAMRIIMQLRLSLPLDEALASGEPTCRAVAFRILCAIRRAISGAPATRQPHQTVLRQLVLIMQGVWGTLVEMEPQDHLGYSNDYRPDVSGRGLGEASARGSLATSSSKDPLFRSLARSCLAEKRTPPRFVGVLSSNFESLLLVTRTCNRFCVFVIT